MNNSLNRYTTFEQRRKCSKEEKRKSSIATVGSTTPQARDHFTSLTFAIVTHFSHAISSFSQIVSASITKVKSPPLHFRQWLLETIRRKTDRD